MAGFNMGGLSDLTKKQEEMSVARSPANNNQLNLSSMEKKAGVVKGSEYGKQVQEQQGVGQLAAQQRTAQRAQGNDMTAGLQGNLGSFALDLQAATNEFLSGRGTSDLNADLSGGAGLSYDPEKGGFVAPDLSTSVTGDVGAIAQEKLAQQQELRTKSAGLFDERGMAKSFEDVLAQFGDTNHDGVIDENEKKVLDQSLAIANQLRRMKELPPDSPELEALRMELMQQDKDGLVSGIMDAMDEYESIVGENRKGFKITGASGEDKQFKDILDMKSEDITSELEKALTRSSGLFGEDMQASLVKDVDMLAEKVRKSSKEEARILNAVGDVADEWLMDAKEDLELKKTELDKKYLETAASVDKELEALKAKEVAEGRDGKWVDNARAWFADIANSVKSGKGSFVDVISEMFSDRALPEGMKNLLEEMTGSDGKLATMLSELSRTGYVTVDGKRVAFSAQDKATIASILNQDVPDEVKKEQIRDILEKGTGALSGDISRASQTIAELIRDGKIDEAGNLMKDAMVKTLSDFKDTVAEDIYSAAKEGKVAPDILAATVKDKAATVSKNITTAANNAITALDKVEKTATRDLTEIATLKQNLTVALEQGRATAYQTLVSTIERDKQAIMTQLQTVASSQGWKRQITDQDATTYSTLMAVRNSKATNGTLYQVAKEMFGDAVDKAIANPLAALTGGHTISVNELLKSQRLQTRLFESTIGYQKLLRIKGQLDKKEAEAKNALDSTAHRKRTIESSVNQQLAALNQFMTVDVNEIMDSAMQGQAYDFLNVGQDSEAAQKGIIEQGMLGYTEDVTKPSDLQYKLSDFANPDSGSWGGKVDIPAKPSAPQGNTFVEKINRWDKRPPIYGGDSHTTYDVDIQGAPKIIRISVPAGLGEEEAVAYIANKLKAEGSEYGIAVKRITGWDRMREIGTDLANKVREFIQGNPESYENTMMPTEVRPQEQPQPQVQPQAQGPVGGYAGSNTPYVPVPVSVAPQQQIGPQKYETQSTTVPQRDKPEVGA